MRNNPHILEINARSWLGRYERELGHKVTLADVPASFWEKIQKMGFDAVWLMGVWKRSPAAQKIARESEDILNQVRASKPDFNKDDITASPYAVYDYVVDEFFGGNEALAAFRKNLNDRGIQLFLDFVGNHTAIDAPVVEEHPELFVTTGKNAPHIHADWFFQNTNGHYIAHGRDPYFAPWTDTAQFNYFNPKTRDFMMQKLVEVSHMCDGVRCDMAMLSLNKVQRDTWWEFIGGELPKEEFWTQALNAVRAEHPEFVFIAEVYWGLEWDIQELGFDYTYDKVLYDRLRFANADSIRGHLRAEHLFQMRSLRFIANHDEEEPLKAFGREKSLAAATIISTLPGARLFHLFQLLGRPVRMPLQYVNDDFVTDQDVERYYWKILEIASDPAFHGGQWSLQDIIPVYAGEESCQHILSWSWRQRHTGKMVFINYSDSPAQCRVPFKGVIGKTVREEIEQKELTLTPELASQGWEMVLKPYECKIFTFAI